MFGSSKIASRLQILHSIYLIQPTFQFCNDLVSWFWKSNIRNTWFLQIRRIFFKFSTWNSASQFPVFCNASWIWKKNAKDERKTCCFTWKDFCNRVHRWKILSSPSTGTWGRKPYLTIKLTVCHFERSTKFHEEIQHCSFGRTQIAGNCYVPNYIVH